MAAAPGSYATATVECQDSVARSRRDILEAAERGELVAEPGLVARLEGAALALEALGEVQPPGR
jgi:hypothetical protein